MFVGGKRAEGGVRAWAAVFAAGGAPRREEVRARNMVSGGSEVWDLSWLFGSEGCGSWLV